MGYAAEEPGTDDLNENVVIVGAGAMGVLFAARMASAGIPVGILDDWAEGTAALRQHGACLQEAGGSRSCYPVQASGTAADFAGTRCAIVLVKSWQTRRAAEALAECLHPDGVALTLQNGLGNRELLLDLLGAERVSAGVTTLGASLAGPGCARPGGEGEIALESNRHSSRLMELFARAGLAARVEPDLQALLWDKLIVNAAINPLTALLGIRNGEMLNIEPARDLALAAAREAAQTAAALSIALPYRDPGERVLEVLRSTAANRSSMLQDVQRGAPTEIEAITGALVRFAESAGVSAPVNRTLYQLVKALAKGRTAGLND